VSYDDNSLVSELGESDVSSAAHGLDGSAGVARYTVTGTVGNNSGGSWGVTEVGLVLSIDDSGLQKREFLIAREVINQVTVSDGEQITVDFIFEVP